MRNINRNIWKSISDAEYIDGLKRGDNHITEAFFYGLCNYTLNDIKYSLMQNAAEYDELVNELYMYLSKNDWRNLDTFKGLNGCTLRSWMSNITWRFFNKRREHLLISIDSNIDNLTDGDYVDSLDELIAKEVEDTLAEMSNEEYAQVLRWMFIEGYDATEVATMLDKKVSNVYNIKHRAIVQFMNVYNSK